ncbi:ABC transporter permease [uncultured Pseudodesulfovibrio sp.]|uniref:ABC transporter permease n=1 Tax=uncultured Pseudodesulfovibrio sp. TaxID=2035858 RepID=UPI0029C6E837|nr:ABC transporter permease [uncultured Pseudodesulfovibrio sp.]
MKKIHFFDLAKLYVIANLKVEVSSYYLNYVWWILEPLFMMATLYCVFEIMLHQGTGNFVGFLFVGIVFWNWFARCIGNSKDSIYNARGLIQQVWIPKTFFPFVVVCQDSVKNLIVTSLLLVFLYFYPTPVSISWICLPILMIIQFVFILATSYFFSAITPFVPDLRFIIGTFTELLFFASGIFYDLDTMVLPQHRPIVYLNPMAGLLKNYRTVLLEGQWPDWAYLGYVFIGSVVFLLGSMALLKKLDYAYPKVCQK